MTTHRPSVRSLILIGGHSTRLGSPKYLLPIPATISQTGSVTPSLIHSINLHHIFQVKHGDPLLRTVTLSVRDDAQRTEVKDLLNHHSLELPLDLDVSFVQDSCDDSGPAAGLTAAWRLDGNAHWLVVGCDYPLMVLRAFEQLLTGHFKGDGILTCYQNSLGWAEPLLGLWSPDALARLSRVKQESELAAGVGPRTILRMFEKASQDGHDGIQGVESNDHLDFAMNVTRLRPDEDEWITSVNTTKDLKEALTLLKSRGRWRAG